MADNNLRSLLGRVKGLGSAKSGTEHWWAQRLSALALIPIIAWFVIVVIKLSLADMRSLQEILRAPVNMVGLMLFITFTLYHGMLGMQVIIEDYCANPVRMVLIVSLRFICIVTAVAGIATVLSFYFSIFN